MRSRLRPEEELAVLVRRHWIVLSAPAVVTLFLAGCAAAVYVAGRPRLVPVAGVALLGAGAWALWRLLDWRCDLWAVTPQRVIDESGVLNVRLIDSPIETIHNVTCEQSLIGRLLGYGTMNIQTAAEHGSVTIRHVAAPAELRDIIIELREQHRRSEAEGVRQRDEAEVRAASETRECPFCAERIKTRARICRFCNRDLTPPASSHGAGRPEPGSDSFGG
jgi:uncharacterized membrane protein YdbT with pleckstrin-like domain